METTMSGPEREAESTADRREQRHRPLPAESNIPGSSWAGPLIQHWNLGQSWRGVPRPFSQAVAGTSSTSLRTSMLRRRSYGIPRCRCADEHLAVRVPPTKPVDWLMAFFGGRLLHLAKPATDIEGFARLQVGISCYLGSPIWLEPSLTFSRPKATMKVFTLAYSPR